jgi:hypothetical protein
MASATAIVVPVAPRHCGFVELLSIDIAVQRVSRLLLCSSNSNLEYKAERFENKNICAWY